MSGFAVMEVPQWQGSGSPVARRLEEGARFVAGLVPSAQVLRPFLSGAPGSAESGVAHFSVLATNLTASREALAQVVHGRDLLVTIGGDCGVESGPIEAAVTRYGERLAVIWFDAHGDLNTPQSSPSGAFHGMVLRALLGEGAPGLTASRPLVPGQVVLAGVRALDDGERDFVDRHRIRHIGVDALSHPNTLVEAVAASGAEVVYIHIDLDVLDPGTLSSVGFPEPGGLTPDALVAAVEALAFRFPVAGLGITEYQPPSDGDGQHDAAVLKALIPRILRAVAAECREIDEHSVQAWPAGRTQEIDGWLVRRTPGVGRRRSNSALPPRQNPEKAIADVESFYTQEAIPTVVQVSPAEHHVILDQLLAARGYVKSGETSVLTARAGDVLATVDSPHQVDLTPAMTDEWMNGFATIDHHSDNLTVAEQVISNIAPPTAFATVTLDDVVSGIGLFVGGEPGGWTAVLCMATDPPQRRKGIARAILKAGAKWSSDRGIDRLYLQVEDENAPALSLYGALGFSYSHGYHYRAKQP